jgi:hypothetical protein
MTEQLIYEDEGSTAYHAVKDVTIINYDDEKRLSICQGCGVIAARGHEHLVIEECSATTNTDGDDSDAWVFGKHVWNHVNEIYVTIDHSVEFTVVDDEGSNKIETHVWHKMPINA